jgi:hypothetical protein
VPIPMKAGPGIQINFDGLKEYTGTGSIRRPWLRYGRRC